MLEVVNLLDEPKPNYKKIWDFQKTRVEQIARNEAPECLILCEHELVITKGRRYKDGNILESSLPIYDIERGGDVTLHQPGQLVVYPLFNLHGDRVRGGLHGFLRQCEEVVIQVLSEYGLRAGRMGPTGVWIQNHREQIKKIASLGVAVRRWITYHGISINISNDLTVFSKIRPCDFDGSIMTSLKNEGLDVSIEELAEDLVNRFEVLNSQARTEAETLGGGTIEFSMPANF